MAPYQNFGKQERNYNGSLADNTAEKDERPVKQVFMHYKVEQGTKRNEQQAGCNDKGIGVVPECTGNIPFQQFCHAVRCAAGRARYAPHPFKSAYAESVRDRRLR